MPVLGVFQIIQLVSMVLTVIPDLIQAAEALFGPKQGSFKKESVLNAVGVAVDIAAAVGNDQAASPDVKTKVLQAASGLVDSSVAIYNAAGAWPKSKATEGPDTK